MWSGVQGDLFISMMSLHIITVMAGQQGNWVSDGLKREPLICSIKQSLTISSFLSFPVSLQLRCAANVSCIQLFWDQWKQLISMTAVQFDVSNYPGSIQVSQLQIKSAIMMLLKFDCCHDGNLSTLHIQYSSGKVCLSIHTLQQRLHFWVVFDNSAF